MRQQPHGDKTTINDATLWTTLSVRVRNTGKRTSDYVGLLFLASKNAGPAPFPNKSLVSYARLHDIAPGTSRDLELELNLGALARADENGDLVIYPGDYEFLFDWDSRLKFRFTLTGRAALLDPLVRQRERYEYTVPVHPKD
jgi:beta-D-xylosidase 4